MQRRRRLGEAQAAPLRNRPAAAIQPSACSLEASAFVLPQLSTERMKPVTCRLETTSRITRQRTPGPLQPRPKGAQPLSVRRDLGPWVDRTEAPLQLPQTHPSRG